MGLAWAGFDHLSWVFDHSSRWSCHLKEGEQRGRKNLAMESVNSLWISAPQRWPLREGRDGKCEGRNEKCDFSARESVSSSPIVRIFGKGKCKFTANFSATLVTSLPSLSLCISLSLSHRKYLTHNIGSASALPIIQRERERERERRKWRHLSRAEIGDEFCTFPCQKCAP